MNLLKSFQSGLIKNICKANNPSEVVWIYQIQVAGGGEWLHHHHHHGNGVCEINCDFCVVSYFFVCRRAPRDNPTMGLHALLCC